MTSVSCVAARRIASLGLEPPATLSAHMARCLTCQAEAARSRRLTRAMALMGTTTLPAPADLMARVEAAVDRRSRRRSPALVPAATAAAVTAVAGAVAVSLAIRRRIQAAPVP